METLVTFSVDDTSPAVSYSPFGDTFSTPNLIGGWNPYFNTSGFATAQGDVGVGASLHITSLDGAALQIQWQGTGITLMGNATRASYSVTLDGQILSNPITSDNVLANIQGLNDTAHTIRLTAQIPQNPSPPNSSMLVFDQAILFSSPHGIQNSTSFQNQTVDDQSIAFRGRWSVAPSQDGKDFHTTSTVGDKAMAYFNGTTFLMLGQTSPTSGNYTVQLDDTITQFNAHSSFTQSDSLLFYATDLNPNVTHMVTVENTDGSDLSLLIGGFKVIASMPVSPTDTSTPALVAATDNTGFSEGTIAAFALAGILAFILISGALFFFLVWRPRRRRRRRAWSASYTEPKRERSPEEPEADPHVMDIGPVAFDHKSEEFGVQSPKDEHPQRWSALSGFNKWRREAVRGSLHGLSLGIKFRHSDSVPGRSPVEQASTGSGGRSGRERPMSGPPSLPSSSESAKRARAKRKGKMRHVSGMSWTPSFLLDLPGHRSRQSQQQRRATNLSEAGRVISMEPSSAAIPPVVALHQPPSYAASVSQHGSVQGSHSTPSSLIPSGPRSVSVSDGSRPQSVRLVSSADARVRPHFQGDEPQAFLLHEGSPETGVSGGRSLSAEPATTDSAPGRLPTAAPVRPLPSTAQFQTSKPTVPTYEVLPPSSSGHGLSRKIVDPRFIDTSLEATDDNPSIEEPRALRAVIRSLSPRTSRSLPVPPPPARRPLAGLVIGSATGALSQQSPEEADSPESASSPTRRLLPEPSSPLASAPPPSRWFGGTPRAAAVKPLPRTPKSDDEGELVDVPAGVFLDVRETSPFRIDFGDNSAGTSVRAAAPSHGDGASTDGSTSDPAFYSAIPERIYKPARNTFGAASTRHSALERSSSGASASASGHGHPYRLSEFVQGSSRLPFRLPTISFHDEKSDAPASDNASAKEPSPASSDGVISFLDFTSSREGSLHVPSERSQKKRRVRNLPAPPLAIDPPKSRWSNTTVATNAPALESSSESQSELPMNPAAARLLPPVPQHGGYADAGAASNRSSSLAHAALHQHPMMESMESPTESLPMSTSEIRFRNPSDSEENAAAPLRILLPQDVRRQQRSSMSDISDSVAEEYRPRAFDPNILVSRVLGLASPASSTTTPRPNVSHSRTQSNVVLSSSRGSPFPPTPRNDSNNELNKNRPGQS